MAALPLGVPNAGWAQHTELIKLLLFIGIDEKPEAVCAYYIDCIERNCVKFNTPPADNGKCINEEITKMLSIAEDDEVVFLEAIYNQTAKDSFMKSYSSL